MKVGDKVRFIKEPTEEDWRNVGEVTIPSFVKEQDCIIQQVNSSGKFIKVLGSSAWYPIVCFVVYNNYYLI